MRHFRCLLFVLQLVGLGSAVLLSPASGQRGPAPGAIDRKDTRVEQTSTGRVVGRVSDADTGVPIEGATVVGQQDGVLAEHGSEPDGCVSTHRSTGAAYPCPGALPGQPNRDMRPDSATDRAPSRVRVAFGKASSALCPPVGFRREFVTRPPKMRSARHQ
jgi:hypothetical protein